MGLRWATAAMFMGFFASLYALFTVKVLGLSPAVIGVVVASGGAFALAGAALSETIVRRLGFGRAFLCADEVSVEFFYLNVVKFDAAVAGLTYATDRQDSATIVTKPCLRLFATRQFPDRLSQLQRIDGLFRHPAVALWCAFTKGPRAFTAGIRKGMFMQFADLRLAPDKENTGRG